MEEASEPQTILKPIIIDDEARNLKALQIALNDYYPSVQFTAIAETPENGIEAIINTKLILFSLMCKCPV